jgi:hypothetical protein
MKSGQLFWGFFLLTIGALFLLVKYDMVVGSFDFVWDIWPFIFVFWGALVIFKNSIARPIINSIFGVFLAMLIFGFFHNTFFGYNFEFDKNDTFVQNYVQDFDSSVKEAHLQIDSGAGVFTIHDTTSNLIEAKSGGMLGDYDFDHDITDGKADFTFQLHKKNFKFFNDKFRNRLDIKLNTKPVWSFDFHTGASKSKYDLSPFNVENLNVETGATNTKIKLGDKSDHVNVSVKMGAASITLEIPKNVGCEINSDMALVAKHFENFNKEGDGHYVTENYENAKKKIYINVEGGVSSFSVYRY